MKSNYKYLILLIAILISGVVRGQAPNWSYTYGTYQNTMRITINLNVSCGGLAQVGPYTVAAFLNGNIAGLTENVNSSQVFITVESPSPQGGTVSFQVWAAGSSEMISVSQTIAFNSNQTGNSVTLGSGGNGNADGDRFCDSEDPCPNTFQTVLSDRDGDGIDDACDAYPDLDNNIDSDGDGIPDAADNDDCGCNGLGQIIEVCDNGTTRNVECRELRRPGVVCGSCSDCSGGPCEDGDPCTEGETWTIGCLECTGGVVVDSDGDGVCNGLDQCPGQDDNRDFDNDGTPDACDADAACFTCEPDANGDITFCWVYPNGRTASFKGDCNNFGTYFDDKGDFKSEKAHCGPCTCASDDDVDTDEDGVCDKQDECPNNPALQKKGQCSCEDEDDNGDGTADSCTRTICGASGNTDHEWIANISVSGQDLSEEENTGYKNHGIEKAFFVDRGKEISISITPTCIGMDCHLSYAIYADWNGDKDFNDADEMMGTWRGAGGYSTTVIVPESAVGEPIIRVIVDYGRITGPCDGFIEGEVEDIVLRFYNDCEVSKESFDYEYNTSIDGMGGEGSWSSSWSQSELSIGVSTVLQQSLYHPDVPSGEGGKLGLLNIANTAHTISRQISFSVPMHISFLYLRNGGKGTFNMSIGDMNLSINEEGVLMLNGQEGTSLIEMNRTYRFLLSLEYDDQGNVIAALTYGDGSIKGSSASIRVSLGKMVEVNSLVITTENASDFLPIAQYLDEFTMSCSIDNLTQFQSEKKAFTKRNGFQELAMNVYPNPVIGDKLSIQLENQIFFDGELQVLDMNGRHMFRKPMQSGEIHLNTARFQSGVYLVIARSSNQLVQSKVVVP